MSLDVCYYTTEHTADGAMRSPSVIGNVLDERNFMWQAKGLWPSIDKQIISFQTGEYTEEESIEKLKRNSKCVGKDISPLSQ